VHRLQGGNLTLFILLFLSLVALTLGQTRPMRLVENAALRFISPLQARLSSLANEVRENIELVREWRELKRRNEELQSQLDRLVIDYVRLKELEAENEALRRLLDFTREHPTHRYKAAMVIGRDPSGLLHYLLIDVGSAEGIREGMPVVTERGLVGRIAETGVHSSKVLLILDPASSVNAIVQGSRATGVVEGCLEGGLVMRYVPQGEEVSVGDIILTSGLGGNFPKGLVIGQVTSVRRRDYEVFQEIKLRPTVDFNRLEVVLVITDFRSPLEERPWRW